MGMEKSPRSIELEIYGQVCPSCLLLALKAVNTNAPALRRGEAEVVILTDDRQATTTIPDATTRMGFQSEVVRNHAGYRIRIYAA
jgi:hypothetical protein